MKIAFEDLYVPDTTVIIERSLSRIVKEKQIKGKIIIPREFINYFESKALQGSALGLLCIQEVYNAINIARNENDIEISFMDSGYRLDAINDISQLDQLARELAKKIGAKILTHNECRKHYVK